MYSQKWHAGYDLWHADRPTLTLNLDYVVQFAQPTITLGVTIHYFMVVVNEVMNQWENVCVKLTYVDKEEVDSQF